MKLRSLIILSAFGALATAIASSCQSEGELNFKRYYSTGQVLYQSTCQNCHSADGSGLGGLIPTLSDSVYLKNNLHYLACIVKKGFEGRIQVRDKIYMGKMAGFDSLTSIEIAEVLTYVNNSFGNKLGLMDVEQVDADLKQCR